MADGSGGFIFALLTDSFVVRALAGTLAAAALSLLALRYAGVRGPRGRRLVILAPVFTAAAAAVASVGGQFLPTVLFAGDAAAAGGGIRMLGATMTPRGEFGILVTAYALVVTVLLGRRAAGVLAVRRLRVRSAPVDPGDPVGVLVERLAGRLGHVVPQVRMLPGCPGGAFATGHRQPALVIDPRLAATLDAEELEGLLAHELAHLRRADPLVRAVVGVARDLAFFLPAVHLSACWLRQEQEESADELAAGVTRRPAALASGILKVWESTDLRAPAGACAAIGTPRLRRLVPAISVGGAPSAWPAWSTADGTAVITRRVERLIAALPSISRPRRRVEALVGVLVTVLAVLTAVVAPGWLSRSNTDLFGFFYLSSDVGPSADSPALATFRALAAGPDAPTATATSATSATAATGLSTTTVGTGSDVAPSAGTDGPAAQVCPCVATPSMLAAGQSAAPTETTGVPWGSAAWELQSARNRASLQANRRLMLLDRSRQQLGFLTASGTGTATSVRVPDAPVDTTAPMGVPGQTAD